jgi:hypothetical protein
VKLRIPGFAVAPLCALVLAGCAHTQSGSADVQSYRAASNREAAVLTARPTSNNLAIAALLSQIGNPGPRKSLDLIERAEALAPRSPELLWLHLTICEQLNCEAKAQIAARLQAVDPDNGFAWLPDLVQAQSTGPEATTAMIVRIGASRRMTFYWNQLVVMTVDALAVAEPSQNLAMRGVGAMGTLAALAIPPLLPLSKACKLEQLDLPGRRAACEAMAARMEQSSTVLTQGLALSLEERWWPAGSPQREIVRAKRRRLDYLMTVSSHTSLWHKNADMALRIDAARRSDREEDVALAVVKSLGLPTEPPSDWKDTLHPG